MNLSKAAWAFEPLITCVCTVRARAIAPLVGQAPPSPRRSSHLTRSLLWNSMLLASKAVDGPPAPSAHMFGLAFGWHTALQCSSKRIGGFSEPCMGQKTLPGLPVWRLRWALTTVPLRAQRSVRRRALRQYACHTVATQITQPLPSFFCLPQQVRAMEGLSQAHRLRRGFEAPRTRDHITQLHFKAGQQQKTTGELS